MKTEDLRHFIEEKAHYFSQLEGYTVLHPELAEIMENYAKALDPEEYERMARKMREVRQREVERLLIENNNWRSEQDQILGQLEKEQQELQHLREKIAGIQRQIVELTKLQEQPPPSPLRWYHSGYVVGLLAFSGIFFLYLGLLLQKRVAVGYVLVGLVCVILGMNVQKEASMRKSPKQRIKRDSTGPLLETKTKAEKVLNIKSVAFAEKKRLAIESVQKLQLAVERNNSKMKLLNE